MKFKSVSLLQGSRATLMSLTVGSAIFAAAASMEPAQAQSNETVLHSFANSGPKLVDGYSPYTGLIMDAKGALYGATTEGGAGRGASSSSCSEAPRRLACWPRV